MTSCWGRLRRLCLGISNAQTRLDRRGFDPAPPDVRRRLEVIGATFLYGYNSALETTEPRPLAKKLLVIGAERRGWAYEGAAMALFLLDAMPPRLRLRCRRMRAFLAGPGAEHAYMAHIGAGWAAARHRLSLRRVLSRFDPLMRWLVVDGFGFHEGYFHWPRTVLQRVRPRAVGGDYAARAFDQGLGRSLWFVRAARPAGIAETIETFDQPRRADLWSGIGLACAYAGGVDAEAIAELADCTGSHRAAVAQGAAFAAKARQRSRNPAEHTDLACRTLCGCSAADAANITDTALDDLPADEPGQPAFEAWRQRIQAHFASTEVAV